MTHTGLKRLISVFGVRVPDGAVYDWYNLFCPPSYIFHAGIAAGDK